MDEDLKLALELLLKEYSNSQAGLNEELELLQAIRISEIETHHKPIIKKEDKIVNREFPSMILSILSTDLVETCIYCHLHKYLCKYMSIGSLDCRYFSSEEFIFLWKLKSICKQ